MNPNWNGHYGCNYETASEVHRAELQIVEQEALTKAALVFSVESLHTYKRTILQHLLVSFCTGWYEGKQQKMLELLIYFMEGFEISSERLCWYSCHLFAIW